MISSKKEEDEVHHLNFQKFVMFLHIIYSGLSRAAHIYI